MHRTISAELCVRAAELLTSRTEARFLVYSLSKNVDNILSAAFKSTAEQYNQGPDLVLVAVGGYGRLELFPYSDIDIMLLAKDKSSLTTNSAQTLLYRLWDMGLNISHSFRTLEECLDDAAHDFKTRTSIIDTRFIAGSQSLFSEFKREVYPKLLFRGKKKFIADIISDVEGRHRIYGESLYLLEPNVKEGRGGLRDTHSLSWLHKVVMKIDSLDEYEKTLPERDRAALRAAREFLIKVRTLLHCIGRRKNDVLSFEFQDPISKAMRLADTRRFLSAEILMRLYYRNTKYVSDVLTKIIEAAGRRYFSLPFQVGLKKISSDFYLLRNEIVVKSKGIFKNPDKILEAFHVFSVSGKRFSHNVRDAIRESCLLIAQRVPLSNAMCHFFIDILKGNRVYETLREMHETGTLDRVIPEFGRLRNLVIYESFHRYTVDEHTLIAIKNLEHLRLARNSRQQYLSAILKGVKKEVLFLAILLHDIGKGDVGRHEQAGYLMIKGVLERLGIPVLERGTIESLVKNHIVLSALALHRDADEPETVTQLADLVMNEETLNALYLMTYADMTAVNPNFLTDWKAYLLQDLYEKTRAHIRGIRVNDSEVTSPDLKRFVEDMPERYAVSHTIDTIKNDFDLARELAQRRLIVTFAAKTGEMKEITVITTDRPGLFSDIVNVLSLRELDVARARLYTSRKGIVVDRILVSNWRDMWWEGIEKQLTEDLEKMILLKHEEPHLTSQRVQTRLFSELRPSHKRFEQLIEIDNESSNEYTLFEIILQDRIGLLYDITCQFSRFDVEIITAVINTEDKIAHDVFYLQQGGQKLDAASILNLLSAVYSQEIEPQVTKIET